MQTSEKKIGTVQLFKTMPKTGIKTTLQGANSIFHPLVGCLLDMNWCRLNFPIHSKLSAYTFAVS